MTTMSTPDTSRLAGILRAAVAADKFELLNVKELAAEHGIELIGCTSVATTAGAQYAASYHYTADGGVVAYKPRAGGRTVQEFTRDELTGWLAIGNMTAGMLRDMHKLGAS